MVLACRVEETRKRQEPVDVARSWRVKNVSWSSQPLGTRCGCRLWWWHFAPDPRHSIWLRPTTRLSYNEKVSRSDIKHAQGRPESLPSHTLTAAAAGSCTKRLLRGQIVDVTASSIVFILLFVHKLQAHSWTSRGISQHDPIPS